jgi:hypothetical protein
MIGSPINCLWICRACLFHTVNLYIHFKKLVNVEFFYMYIPCTLLLFLCLEAAKNVAA